VASLTNNAYLKAEGNSTRDESYIYIFGGITVKGLEINEDGTTK
jgi:hypothetical protein